MNQSLKLKEGDQAYAPASATDVQKTWKRVCNWVSPEKDPTIVAKWEYYKSLALRSEQALQTGEQ